jgi:hypothetical protein
MKPITTAAAICLAMTATTCAAQAAPKELYGKSVTVSWLETRSQRDGQSGPFKPVGLPFTNVFYISTEGRLFARSSTRSPGGAGAIDRVGTSGGNAAGDARNVTFSGNRIVSNAKFQGAARHIEIGFDPGFSSCTAQVITAMPSGAKTAVVRSITTGSNVEFESVSAGPASCSIATGNPF